MLLNLAIVLATVDFFLLCESSCSLWQTNITYKLEENKTIQFTMKVLLKMFALKVQTSNENVSIIRTTKFEIFNE